MENFYFVEKNASSMKAFLKMFFEFHDFRVYAVNYNPANERIDIIMEYDNGEDKVLIRLEKDVDMNFCPTDDYAADWLYNCEVRLDETNTNEPKGELFYLFMNEIPWSTAEQFSQST